MNNDLISRDAVLDACSQSINILDAMSRIEDLPSVKPKPCEDAISRQAAIDVVSGIDRHFVKYIKELPSVTPKQRAGHWIKISECPSFTRRWECSSCGCCHRALYDFCPSCGAKMIKLQESKEGES